MFGVEHDLDLLQDVDIRAVYTGLEGQRDMKAMWFLWEFLSGKKVNSHVELQGFSLSWRGNMCRLTLRALVDGTPRVAFISDRATMGCVRTAARWLLEGRVKWHVDQYA